MSTKLICADFRAGLCAAIWSSAALCVVAGASRRWWIALPLVAIALAICAWSRSAMSRRTKSDLDRAHLDFIETMAQALDARDRYTAGHSFRVSSYALVIARELKLPEASAEIIRAAALLHDIGKIGIPDAVLQKAGPLTAEEYGLIKLHPQIGRKILEKLDRFQELLPVVELHHENFDGTGYPYRLAGAQIPLAARIVRVADAFDSMVTHRHYRDARSLRTAIDELITNAGSQFDPEIVCVMVRLIERGVIAGFEPGSPLLSIRDEVLV